MEAEAPELRRAGASALAGFSDVDPWQRYLVMPPARQNEHPQQPALPREQIMNGLGRLLADPDARVRDAAAVSLLAFHDQRATRELLLAVLNDREPEVRLAALNAMTLAWPGSHQIIQQCFIRFPGEHDPNMRAALAELLSRQGGAACAEALLTALHDADPDVRRLAIVAQGPAKARNAVEQLLPLLRDPDPVIRADAAHALGEIGDTRAFPTLLSLAHDPGDYPRREAVLALLALGDKRALPVLLDAASDTDEIIRTAAFRALPSFIDPQKPPADPHLVRLAGSYLQDKDGWLRLEAAELLAECGKEQGWSALGEIAASRGGDALEATDFLVKSRAPRALAVLLAVHPADEEMAEQYFAMLAGITDPRVTARFAAAIAANDPHVRLGGTEIRVVAEKSGIAATRCTGRESCRCRDAPAGHQHNQR